MSSLTSSYLFLTVILCGRTKYCVCFTSEEMETLRDCLCKVTQLTSGPAGVGTQISQSPEVLILLGCVCTARSSSLPVVSQYSLHLNILILLCTLYTFYVLSKLSVFLLELGHRVPCLDIVWAVFWLNLCCGLLDKLILKGLLLI